MKSEDMTGKELLSWRDKMSKAEKATAKKIMDDLDATPCGFIDSWLFVRTVIELRQIGSVIDVASLFRQVVLAGVNAIRDKHKLPNEYLPPVQKSKPVRGV